MIRRWTNRNRGVSVVTRKLMVVATVLIGGTVGLTGCGEAGEEPDAGAPGQQSAPPETAEAPGVVELQLASGFVARVFAPELGRARHLAVRDNGDVYVALRDRDNPRGYVALQDTDGDGVADVTAHVGEHNGTGIAVSGDHLYFSSDTEVYRARLSPGELLPKGAPEKIAGGFPEQRAHAAKTLALDAAGHLYVNSGAPSNACQEQIRTAGSPGRQPCPDLERSGGIWRFDAALAGQDQTDGERFVTGIRNAVALAWNPLADSLYFLQHGRDQLDTLWPDLYTAEDRAELPAEEFHVAEAGANYGWPYTYYDSRTMMRMISPEYGGDAQRAYEGDEYREPLLAFPAHWAPNALLFYTGAQFPERYHGGAFVAFHGSWNRAPAPQGGYKLVFVPFSDGVPAGDWEVFAEGFPGLDPVENPGDARHRPAGLAQGPDGSLYVADSVQGTIWRITYAGG